MPGPESPPTNPPMSPGDYLDKALAWSQEVWAKVACQLNVAYGTEERQKLDVYLPGPAATGPVPVLMFIHGGYWVVGHKDKLGFMAPPLTCAPAVLVTPGYRLAPGSKYPEQVDDCRVALKWVYDHIAEYGGDPDRIFLGGHSAGGHLAALVTLQTERLASSGLPADVVKGCFPVSGVFDVTDAPPDRRDAFLASPDHAKEASPVHNAPGNRTPFLLEIGGNDFPNLRNQHPAMLKALQGQPGPVEEMVRQGHDHFQISLDHGESDNPWSRRVRELMARPAGGLLEVVSKT